MSKLALLGATALATCLLAMPARAEQAQSATHDHAHHGEKATDNKPTFGTFGFDAGGMDRTVDAADDFYQHASGNWAKSTPIPADRSNYGMFTLLDDLSQKRTREIVEMAATTPGDKVGDLYASFMDEAAADSRGIAPVAPLLAQIKALKTNSEASDLLGRLITQGNFVGPFVGFVAQDDKDPTRYIVQVAQSGLGMPDRDYYLKDSPEMAKARDAYAAYLAKLLSLAGEADAPVRAAAIVKMETEIAKGHWTRVASRDSDKTYNKWTLEDFASKAPGFNWAGYFTAVGVGAERSFIAMQPEALASGAKVLADTPVGTVRDYLTVHILNDMAPYLGKSFVDAAFDFNSKTMNGIPENQPRWKRGVDLVKNAMGEAVGQQYVARYFPPEAKTEADRLVKNVIAAFDARLAKLEWMSPATRDQARAKLAAFKPKIGYPDKWRDYAGLEIKRDDLAGNVMRSNAFEVKRNIAKLGKPIDRDEWFMTPMEVNAYANPVMNEIVFPAAILQPPFFDLKADAAINYGAIGAVIGHEISHHFDDQGRKYDKNGALTDWWTAEDVKRFTALTDELVKQYNGYEVLPGKTVNGQLTLGENIADLAGLTVAYDAWKASLGGKTPPVIDGYTGEQRFYFGWAQFWRRNYREANLAQRLLTDPHSPSAQRVWVVRNLDPWYAAFKAKPTGKLSLPPEKRLRIW